MHTNKNQRLWAFDILKFLLSIIIVLHHFQQITGFHNSVIVWWNGIIYWGYVVELFFIISGLLCAMYYKRHEQTFRSYIINKIIRIYPMAVLSILLTAAAGIIYYIRFGEWFYGNEITAWKIINNCTLLFSGGPFNSGNGINSPLWYLSVLMYCYVIFYFLEWLGKALNVDKLYFHIAMIIIGESVINYGINIPFFSYNDARGYVSFFLGVVICRLINNQEYNLIRTILKIELAVCFLIGIIDINMIINNQRELLTYVLYPLVVLLCLRMPNWFGGSKFVEDIGNLSYEIYIWHAMLLVILDLFMRENKISLPDNDVTLVIFVTVVVCVSLIMLYLVDYPIANKIKNMKKI